MSSTLLMPYQNMMYTFSFVKLIVDVNYCAPRITKNYLNPLTL
jgi:hypothetical protein